MFKLKKAEMGMGTLIIFIAMILVAAVAAGVLITTTGTLQNKALKTGKATTNEIGTSLSPVEIYAEDAENQTIKEFGASIKLSSGSGAVRFADILVALNLKDSSSDYEYSTAVSCDDESTTTAGGNYGVNYSIKGNNYNKGYLNRGDVTKLCFQSPREIQEDESIKLELIPKIGSTLILEMNVPDLMVDKRIYLYP